MDRPENNLPSNRNFGFVFSIFFILLSLFFYFKDYSFTSLIFLIFFSFFLVSSLVNPGILVSANKLWFKFGLLLGRIISPLIMGIIFFLIFCTLAILMRLFGRDELKVKVIDKNSYWIKRRHASETSFKLQF
tara:strand:+ start:322 stop:717 length:396 start_codon:yes stop_codon:yes gene_type:complete